MSVNNFSINRFSSHRSSDTKRNLAPGETAILTIPPSLEYLIVAGGGSGGTGVGGGGGAGGLLTSTGFTVVSGVAITV